MSQATASSTKATSSNAVAPETTSASPTSTTSMNTAMRYGTIRPRRGPPDVRELYSRHACMSVTRMPRAPRSQRSSITRLVSARGTIARTATQPSPVQRRHGRRLDAGCQRAGILDELDLHVVVHHHVGPRHDDALQTTDELVHGSSGGEAGPADQHRLGLEDRLTEDLEAGLAQRAPGLDDVGDDVSDAKPHRGLHRAVEADHLTGDAGVGEVLRDEAGIGGRDPEPGEVGDRRGGFGPGREPERRLGEAERQDLLRGGAAVQEQVTARDADVELSGPDVHGDVARSQEEELGAAVEVLQDQLAYVAALPVTGLTEHRAGRLGERALVGNGDPEQAGLGRGQRGHSR